MTDMAWEHAAEARAALNAIVSDPEHGVAALSSPQMMSNLLKDYLPDAPREKSIMVAAAEAGLASTIREHVANGMDPATATRLAASSFSASTPFTAEACNWVAGEFAVALGLAPATSAAAPGSASPTIPGMPAPGVSPGAATQVPGNYGAGGFAQGAAAGAGLGQAGQPGTGGQAGPGFQAPPQGQAYQSPAGGQAPGSGYQQGGAYQPTQGYAGGGSPGAGGSGGAGGYQAGAGGSGGAGGAAGYQQGTPSAPGGYGYQGATPGYSPGGWQGGGYPPIGGPGGAGGGRRRGWMIGGGVVGALIIVVGVVVALTNSGSNGGGGGPTGSGSPTRSVSTSPSPTQSTSATVESLTQLLTTVGSNCGAGTLAGLNKATLTDYQTCSTTVSTITVYGWQFDNNSDYLTGLNHLRSYTGFNDAAAGPNCPPSGSSTVGGTGWYSKSDSRFPKTNSGQVFDCYTDHLAANGSNNQATYLWTFPQYNIILLAQNPDSGGGFTPLNNWWANLSYG